MLKNTALILATTMAVIGGTAFLHAQEASPMPRDHMMMGNMGNMHAQMSRMAENCNKMMERMMQPSSSSQNN